VDKDEDDLKFNEIDEEDERRDEEMETFEEKYNFRFEEPGAENIMSKVINIFLS
jgi:hypothetical protein